MMFSYVCKAGSMNPSGPAYNGMKVFRHSAVRGLGTAEVVGLEHQPRPPPRLPVRETISGLRGDAAGADVALVLRAKLEDDIGVLIPGIDPTPQPHADGIP